MVVSMLHGVSARILVSSSQAQRAVDIECVEISHQESDTMDISPECVVTLSSIDKSDLVSALKLFQKSVLDCGKLRILVDWYNLYQVTGFSNRQFDTTTRSVPNSSECVLCVRIEEVNVLDGLAQYIFTDQAQFGSFHPHALWLSTLRSVPKIKEEDQELSSLVAEEEYSKEQVELQPTPRPPLAEVGNTCDIITRYLSVHKTELGKIIGPSAQRITFIRKYTQADVLIKSNKPEVAYASVKIKGYTKQVENVIEIVTHYLSND